MKKIWWIFAGLVLAPASLVAHHSPVVYDGKQTVRITGTVTRARYGYPHSRYEIDVVGEDGASRRWVLMTEDPRDAKSLGFDDELRAIAEGDEITVVGWPHKYVEREIRGHQLHYADGTVVMMRRGNYIWTEDLRRIWRLRDHQVDYPAAMRELPAGLPPAERVIAWIDEDDAPARVAREIENGSAALVGIDSGAGYEFAGVGDDFVCHTRREDFRLEIDAGTLTEARRRALEDGAGYIERYNDLMATYWEYDIESCR